jgi:AcrR family transcriptional regulator
MIAKRPAGNKGEETKQSILKHALKLTSEVGLEGLSFGELAKRSGLSKSGLYAHFDSKESLQSEVLDAAASRFVDLVVSPALKQPRGIPRLTKLFDLWLQWGNQGPSGGCPFVAAATDFDDRPGPVRSCLIGHMLDILGTIARAAKVTIEAGQFRADLDTEQFAFEVWGVVLSYHHYSRLLDRKDADQRAQKAFETILRHASSTS